MDEARWPVNAVALAPGKDVIIWFRPLVMEPTINRLEVDSGTIAPTREEL
jgi:hypothetical protein